MSSEFNIAVAYITNGFHGGILESPCVKNKVSVEVMTESTHTPASSYNPGPPQYNGNILENLDQVWAEVGIYLACCNVYYTKQFP